MGAKVTCGPEMMAVNLVRGFGLEGKAIGTGKRKDRGEQAGFLRSTIKKRIQGSRKDVGKAGPVKAFISVIKKWKGATFARLAMDSSHKSGGRGSGEETVHLKLAKRSAKS